MQEVHLGGTPLAHPGGANNDHLSDQVHDHSSGQVKVHFGGFLGTHSGGDPTARQGDSVDDVSDNLNNLVPFAILKKLFTLPSQLIVYPF